MKWHTGILFFLCILSFLSCDILRSSLFEVISWTPGGGYHSDPENVIVSLTFSHDPHKSGIERHFSLTGDGNRIRGNFEWEGKKLIFIPLTPLEKNIDYIINLSAEARNTKGLSMDDAFNVNFSSRAGSERITLITCYPSMYEVISDFRSEVKLEFSLPVLINTLYEYISFIPSMPGFWVLENENCTAVFTPLEPWIRNSRYEIRISSMLTDSNGVNIRNNFTSIFFTGNDNENPYLISAGRLTKNNEIIDLIPDKNILSIFDPTVENTGWEKEDRLLLVFSKPVDTLVLKNSIITDNGPNLIMETFPDFNTEIIFRFESIPPFNSRFNIRIKPGIQDRSGLITEDEYLYKIHANGKNSKPPEFAGIRIPMAPRDDDDNEPVSYSIDSIYEIIPITNKDYPSGEIIPTWIELYFIITDGASVDIFSVMELFRIDSSNNVISFSPRQIKTSNFSFSEPHESWIEYQRIEITGNFINTTNFGIINFHIASGLKDSLGNRNEKPFRISVIK